MMQRSNQTRAQAGDATVPVLCPARPEVRSFSERFVYASSNWYGMDGLGVTSATG
jgi:hypothetical protein